MDSQGIKGLYSKDNGREAALAAYPQAIADNKGKEDRLNELAFIAADFAHAEALKILFDAGVQPTAADKYGFTLLHFLARQQESRYHVIPKGAVAETVALLLDNNVSALRKDENEKLTCYHYAARNGLAEMIGTLAGKVVKLNMTDPKGNTGIHIACEYAKHAILQASFRKKEIENAKAILESKETFLKERGMAGEEMARNTASETAAVEKALKNHEDAVKLTEDYLRTVKAFAEGGTDKDEKNSHGITALDIAVKSDAKRIATYLAGDDADGGAYAGGMTLHQAAEKGDVEAIKALAKKGADLNGVKGGEKHNLRGCTPLAVACAHLNASAAEALLAYGADPSYKDGNGKTAAAYLTDGYRGTMNSEMFKEKRLAKMIKDMIYAGMDINMPADDDGNTLLMLACRSGRGQTINRQTIKGDILDEILRHKVNINATNRFGETALMHACAKDFDIMENVQLTLLERGADAKAADADGDTPLHYVARNDNVAGAKALCDILLEFGADAKTVNNAGKTALDIAVERNSEPLVKLLLSKM